jgi:hypothetical protein
VASFNYESTFRSSLSRVIFSRFNMLKFRLFLSLFLPSLLPVHLIPNSSISLRPVSNPTTLFLFASFSNTPGCNLKFDGHHSSYGRLICHYCLKIPQVFACICVVFAFPFIRYIRLWQYAGTCYTAVKGIPRRLKDPRIYFCVYMNLLLGLILSDILTYTFIPF